MPRGGPRAGSGGARPGAGRPRKHAKLKRQKADIKPPVEAAADVPVVPLRKEPLAYMLDVVNDPNADQKRRDYMAVAAAPYVHAKAGETGKKDQKLEAAKKVASRFGSSTAPPRPSITH